jgi:SAM-dependent methyltransferase
MTTLAKDIDMDALRSFYGEKYRRHGVSAEAVGWQSAAKQRQRFDVLCAVGDLQGKTLLDVGCGFGDLLANLKDRGIRAQYHGVDVMDSFVSVARANHPDGKFWTFDVRDECPPDFKPPFDYVFASGLLGLHIGDDAEYARTLLRRMFEWCRIGVAANMISTYVDYREDYLAYTNPEEIFAFCKKNLTWKVALRHDYMQYEFSIFLYR